MLDFLKECGIKNEIIVSLESKLFDNMQFNLNCNELEIKKIINYFNEIGITCTDDLLLNNIDLFLFTFSQIKEKFDKYDIPKLVELINNDYEVINQL